MAACLYTGNVPTSTEATTLADPLTWQETLPTIRQGICRLSPQDDERANFDLESRPRPTHAQPEHNEYAVKSEESKSHVKKARGRLKPQEPPEEPLGQ